MDQVTTAALREQAEPEAVETGLLKAIHRDRVQPILAGAGAGRNLLMQVQAAPVLYFSNTQYHSLQ